jgi:hypothetical protein
MAIYAGEEASERREPAYAELNHCIRKALNSYLQRISK